MKKALHIIFAALTIAELYAASDTPSPYWTFAGETTVSYMMPGHIKAKLYADLNLEIEIWILKRHGRFRCIVAPYMDGHKIFWMTAQNAPIPPESKTEIEELITSVILSGKFPPRE